MTLIDSINTLLKFVSFHSSDHRPSGPNHQDGRLVKKEWDELVALDAQFGEALREHGPVFAMMPPVMPDFPVYLENSRLPWRHTPKVPGNPRIKDSGIDPYWWMQNIGPWLTQMKYLRDEVGARERRAGDGEKGDGGKGEKGESKASRPTPPTSEGAGASAGGK